MNRRDCIALGIGVAASVESGAVQTETPVPKLIEWPTLTLLGGGTIDPAQWQGHFSVLVLWATWCPYCKRHNAHVDKLYREAQGQSLRVLGISVDADRQLVDRYMQSNGYSFPTALDTVGLRARLTARKSIPMTFVIDSRGRLAQTIPGEMSEEDVLAFAKLAKSAST